MSVQAVDHAALAPGYAVVAAALLVFIADLVRPGLRGGLLALAGAGPVAAAGLALGGAGAARRAGVRAGRHAPRPALGRGGADLLRDLGGVDRGHAARRRAALRAHRRRPPGPARRRARRPARTARVAVDLGGGRAGA